MKTLGDRLRNARERKELSQIDVYKKTGINNKTISNYENNVSSPDPDTLARFATLYDVSVDFLLGRVDDPRNKIVSKDQLPPELADIVDYIEILKDADIKDISPEEFKYAIEFAKRIKGKK